MVARQLLYHISHSASLNKYSFTKQMNKTLGQSNKDQRAGLGQVTQTPDALEFLSVRWE
jgi:hypothetical protein